MASTTHLPALNADQEHTKLALAWHHGQTASSVLQGHMVQDLAIQLSSIAPCVELGSMGLPWEHKQQPPASYVRQGHMRLGLAALCASCAQLASIRLVAAWWPLKTAAYAALGHTPHC